MLIKKIDIELVIQYAVQSPVPLLCNPERFTSLQAKEVFNTTDLTIQRAIPPPFQQLGNRITNLFILTFDFSSCISLSHCLLGLHHTGEEKEKKEVRRALASPSAAHSHSRRGTESMKVQQVPFSLYRAPPLFLWLTRLRPGRIRNQIYVQQRVYWQNVGHDSFLLHFSSFSTKCSIHSNHIIAVTRSHKL